MLVMAFLISMDFLVILTIYIFQVKDSGVCKDLAVIAQLLTGNHSPEHV